jgi:hypothetical protein
MLIILLLIITCVRGYHTTDNLIQLIKKECDATPELSFHMHDDIPVVEWKENLPKDIVWAFNEHARERITAELALEMIVQLKHLRPNRRVTILPVVNVWGRKLVEAGKICQRKNKRGVDTNRNYPQKVHHVYHKTSEEYQGKYPISEKETKLVSAVLRGAKKYINVHSGEFSLYMPWDSITERPPNYKNMMNTLKTYSRYCPECSVGPAAIKSFYKAYGSSVDYATTLGIEAYTFEIFGKQHEWNCDRMFNPHGEEYDKVIKQWKSIMSMTLS